MLFLKTKIKKNRLINIMFTLRKRLPIIIDIGQKKIKNLNMFSKFK